MNTFTRAGTQGTERRIGDELIVYDPRSAQMHALNATAAAVLGAVPMTDSVTAAEIRDRVAARSHQSLDIDVVRVALAELADAGLVVARGRTGTLDRRALLVRGGVAATAATAWPLIQTIVAPSVAAAQSGGGGGGGGGGGLLTLHRMDAGHEGDISTLTFPPPAAVVQVRLGGMNVTGYTTVSSSNNDIASAAWYVTNIAVFAGGLRGGATLTFTYTDPNPPNTVLQTYLTVTNT